MWGMWKWFCQKDVLKLFTGPFCFSVQISTKCEHCVCKNWSSSYRTSSPQISSFFTDFKVLLFWQQGQSSAPLPNWSSTQDKGAFLLMTTAGFVLASTKNFTQRLNHHWSAEFSGLCFSIMLSASTDLLPHLYNFLPPSIAQIYHWHKWPQLQLT